MESQLKEQLIKEQLMKELERLPSDKCREVLDFVRSLKERVVQEGTYVPSLPASSLDGLTGLVALGGDALIDSESLYDGSI